MMEVFIEMKNQTFGFGSYLKRPSIETRRTKRVNVQIIFMFSAVKFEYVQIDLEG